MEQRKNKLNVALLSPAVNAYSETFIQAHKKLIKENIFHYYGGLIPDHLDGYGKLDIIKNPIFSFFRKAKDSRDRIKTLEESLRKNKIDVAFIEYGYTAAESFAAIKNSNIPLVVHFHGADAHSKDALDVYSRQYLEIFEYASCVIVVSQFMKRHLVTLGCPENKILYTVCAPNDEYFDVKPLFKSQQFLAVGRFVDKKAPYYTILAFKGVVEKYPESILKMAADGPLLPVCKNLVRYLNLQGSVKFIGVVDRVRIKEEMVNSIAFVQHSITAENGDSEGTPVAIMESGAAALPVIATRHAGIPDVIVEGETGLLVDEHDVSGMTEAMKSIIGNLDFSRIMGENARKRIMEYYTMEKHIFLIENAIKKACR